MKNLINTNFCLILSNFVAFAFEHFSTQKNARSSERFLVYLPLENYFLGFLMLACAAASLAIGTLKGEQET